MTGLSKEVSFVLTIVLAALATCAFAQIPNATPPESRVWFGKWENKVAEGTLDVAKTRATVAVDIPTTVFLTNGTNFPFTRLSIEDREYVASALGTSPRFFRKYAFIVASASYGQMPPLPSVENDGEAIYKLVTEKLGFNRDDVVYLRNDKDYKVIPTKRNIENKFKKFVDDLESDSFVFVYFAGHGCQNFSTGETFYLPCDAESDDALATSVSLNKLFKSICDSGSNATPWFVVDACREEQNEENVDDLIVFDNSEKSFVLMQACAKGDVAIENEEHGYFSQALIEAFDGKCDFNKDRIVSLNEVWSFVLSRTQEISNGWQVPKQSSYGFDNIDLFNLYKEYINPYGMKFNLISAGTFMMGATDTSDDEAIDLEDTSSLADAITKLLFDSDDSLLHKVSISKSFYVGVYEVTKGDYERFVKATDYKTTAEQEGFAWGYDESGSFDKHSGLSWLNPGFEQTERDPVVCISFEDALAFIDWLNKADDSLPLGYHYALPTEAEWEYACRGGCNDCFFWGEAEEDGQGYVNGAGKDKTPWNDEWFLSFSFSDGYSATCPVDAPTFKPNDYGLYHMLGNAMEWCSDWYGDYTAEYVRDPIGPKDGEFHVARGGYWGDSASGCRCSKRFTLIGVTTSIGFRLVIK